MPKGYNYPMDATSKDTGPKLPDVRGGNEGERRSFPINWPSSKEAIGRFT